MLACGESLLFSWRWSFRLDGIFGMRVCFHVRSATDTIAFRHRLFSFSWHLFFLLRRIVSPGHALLDVWFYSLWSKTACIRLQASLMHISKLVLEHVGLRVLFVSLCLPLLCCVFFTNCRASICICLCVLPFLSHIMHSLPNVPNAHFQIMLGIAGLWELSVVLWKLWCLLKQYAHTEVCWRTVRNVAQNIKEHSGTLRNTVGDLEEN